MCCLRAERQDVCAKPEHGGVAGALVRYPRGPGEHPGSGRIGWMRGPDGERDG